MLPDGVTVRVWLPLALALLGAVALSGSVSCERKPSSGDPASPDAALKVAPSSEEVFAGFRKSHAEDRMEEFECWVVEICDRRLLADLSSQDILERLGEPDSRTWTYLDASVGDSFNPVKRLLAAKGDYWDYSIYRPDEREQAAFGLVFDDEVLVESQYGRGNRVTGEVQQHFKTRWTSRASNGSVR